MARPALVGSRIRERRSLLGLRQADVARAAGISPAYLNLIEHNRRRIGADVLEALAEALATDPAALAEGEQSALLEGLRAAAAGAGDEGAEVDRIEELAGRFPGWAALAAAQGRRIERLERTVTALSDRLTYDPFLSAALHEVLSAATSIRSTAAILAEGGIDPGWQDRFHANLDKDSERLASAAGSLVGFLDFAPEAEATLVSPQETAEQWLETRGTHLPELEAGGDPLSFTADLPAGPARVLAEATLTLYAEDARALPLAPFAAAWAEGADPLRLAAAFGADLPRVLRRVASLPGVTVGLVTCDASGTLTFRRGVEGFPLPRFGAACALWPLFRALAHPGLPVRQEVEMAGRRPHRFTVWAYCRTDWPEGLDGPEVAQATMLILPSAAMGPAAPVGTSCRICPRLACVARREPSILMEEG